MSRTRQLKVSIESGLAEKFKKRCAANEVSMAERITQLLEAETGARTVRNKCALSLDTRGQRRGATRKIVALLEAVKDREEIYAGNIPESLKGGIGYEAALETIDALDQAICLLDDAF